MEFLIPYLRFLVLVGLFVISIDGAGKEKNKVSQFVRNVNDFGFHLYHAINDSAKNVFISPFSIYSSLAVLHLGAKENTAKQLAMQMNPDGSPGSICQELMRVFGNVNLNRGSSELLFANGIFIQQTVIDKNFTDEAGKHCNAQVKLVDFQTERVAREITEWVQQNTHNKISNFVVDGLEDNLVLSLVNAVYFKGLWKTQFSPEDGEVHDFHLLNGRIKKVEYMIQRQVEYPSFSDYDWDFLQLPYEDGSLSMLIALPTNEEKNVLELSMTSAYLNDVLAKLQLTKLQEVGIPKFKMEYKRNLKKDLEAMGIKDMFDKSSNLSGISRSIPLSVKIVDHAAVIEVNEKGSEAAAATKVDIGLRSSGQDFFADRPFVFFILDTESNLVLFTGRLVDPSRRDQ